MTNRHANAGLFDALPDPVLERGHYERARKISAEVLSTRRRDRALESVADNAEQTSPGFGERAAAFILEYLRKHGATPGEQLTAAAIAAGIKPHDMRAFGPVYLRLSKRKHIAKAGSCQRVRGNMTSGGIIWALGSN